MSVEKQWWINRGKTVRFLVNGRKKIVKPNERFLATQGEIPVKHRSAIVPVEFIEKKPTTEVFVGVLPEVDSATIPREEVIEDQKEAPKVELPSSGSYYRRRRDDGKYDIVDEGGKVFNEEPLKRSEAAKLMEQLKA